MYIQSVLYYSNQDNTKPYGLFCSSNPLLYPDFIFYRTNAGRNFKELCDYVHDFADVIIKKRRKALVRYFPIGE